MKTYVIEERFNGMWIATTGVNSKRKGLAELKSWRDQNKGVKYRLVRVTTTREVVK